MSAGRRPLLIVGLPRSGTTWTENVLGTAVGASTVSEPDNEKLSAPAIWAKRRLGRFPVLSTGDQSLAYRRLWAWALGGAPTGKRLRAAQRLIRDCDAEEAEQLVKGRGAPRQRLVEILGALPGSSRSSGSVVAKSVHACLAIDWIAAQFDVDVLVVLRHPANVLSSWLELDLPDRDRDLGASALVKERYLEKWNVPMAGTTTLERAAWQVGLFTAALEQSASLHRRWIVRTHEQLCSDPEGEFRKLFGELGLEWGPATSSLLEESDNPGTGFTLTRKASELPESWRARLSEEEVQTLAGVLRPFPIKTWDPTDLSEEVNGRTGWLEPRALPDRN
jgi:hypothetical protein